ncbi:MAG: hypothetical protein ABR583_06635 [Gaiellaceae bacterium]
MAEHPDDLLAERFAALPTSAGRADWLDVRRRARRPGRRWATAVVVAALVLAAPAFALERLVVDFFSAERAPERIQLEYARMEVIAPRAAGLTPIAGEARKVLETRFRGRRTVMWVAPTRAGGFCWRWVFGSCFDPSRARVHGPAADQFRFNVVWEGNETMTAAGGAVVFPELERLEIRYADGEGEEIPFTWVSEPIGAGFFVFDVPDEHRGVGRRVIELVALDGEGDVIAQEPAPSPGPSWEFDPKTNAPDVAILAEKRALIELTTERGRRLVAWTAPARYGWRCVWLTVDGEPGPTGRCGGEVRNEPVLSAGLSTGAGPVLLAGEAREDVAVVELRYEDGDLERTKPVEGYVLHEIRSPHYPRGHRLELMVALDASGRELERRPFPTDQHSVYPCERKVDVGLGVITCP